MIELTEINMLPYGNYYLVHDEPTHVPDDVTVYKHGHHYYVVATDAEVLQRHAVQEEASPILLTHLQNSLLQSSALVLLVLVRLPCLSMKPPIQLGLSL